MLYADANDSLRAIIGSTAQSDTSHINALLALGVNYNTFNYDTTKKYALASLNASKTIQWQLGVARAERLLGFAGQRRGLFGEAIQYYTNAISKFENVHDYSGLGECYNGLGIIMFEQGNYTKSVEYYNRAASYFMQAENFVRVVAPYLNIAYSFLQMSAHYDSAMVYNQRALMYSEQYNAGGIPFYLINSAILALESGDIRTARVLTDSALAHPTASTNVIVLTRAYYFLGLLLLRQDKYDSALAYYHKGLDIARQSRFLYRIQDGYNFLAQAYRDKGDFSRAYMYRDSAIILHDSLLNARTVGQIETLQSTLQQAKIELLEEAQKADAALRNGLIAAAIMALVLVGFMIYANRQRAKANTQLTEQKTALELVNAQLSLLNEQLIEANNYKMKLMSIVSHDLKNPLGGIQISAEMIQIGLRKHAEQFDSALRSADTIIQAVSRMNRFISDMLDMTAAESRNMELTTAKFEICEMIMDVVRDFALTARKKKQMMVADLPLHCFLVADRNRLRQVMENILSNALKYAPHESQIHIIVSIDTHQHFVCRILDQGPGFKPEDFERLFQSFQKLSARPTGGESSTGIGLTIAKQITELHGGTISAQNRTDAPQGAEFVIRIPAVELSVATKRYMTMVPDASLSGMEMMEREQGIATETASAPLDLRQSITNTNKPINNKQQEYVHPTNLALRVHHSSISREQESVITEDTYEIAETFAHSLVEMSEQLPPNLHSIITEIIDALFFQEYERCLPLIHQLGVQNGITRSHIAMLRDLETAILERKIATLLQTANQLALKLSL